MGKIKKAVIPAAGMGTRFLPATKAQPKEMLPIVDKPSIQYIVEEAVASGIEDILIITGRGKRAIEDHFDKSFELEESLAKKNKRELAEEINAISELADIHYIRQKESLGLGHAVYQARKFIGSEPFALLLGDDLVHSAPPCLAQLMEVYERYNTTIIGVQEVAEEDTDKYGIISGQEIADRVVKIDDLIEKPPKEIAPSNLAIMGRYIISADIFEILSTAKPGKRGEIELTDALKILGSKQQLYAYLFAGQRYDVGDKLGYIRANLEFALRRKELKDDLWEYLNQLIKTGGIN